MWNEPKWFRFVLCMIRIRTRLFFRKLFYNPPREARSNLSNQKSGHKSNSTLLKRTALRSVINTISRYVLLLRQDKLQFRWIPHQLLCHLLRHPDLLHHRHVHHHAPQPLEVILLSNIKVSYVSYL